MPCVDSTTSRRTPTSFIAAAITRVPCEQMSWCFHGRVPSPENTASCPRIASATATGSSTLPFTTFALPESSERTNAVTS